MNFITALPGEYHILVGDARGVDRKVIEICREFDHPFEVYQANWTGEGKKAGIRRNLEMLDRMPVRVVAFWDGMSHGTGFMVKTALTRRINLQVFFDF